MQQTPEKLLAEWVQIQRKERGWTQQDLADRLTAYGVGMHSTAVTRLEQGARTIRFNEAIALLEAFDMSMGELVGYMATIEDFGSRLEFQLHQIEQEPPTLLDTAATVENIVSVAHTMIAEHLARHRAEQREGGAERG